MTGSFTKCNVIRTLILLQFSAKYLWLFPRCYETKNRPNAVCLLAARIGSTDQFHGSWWMPARATAGKKTHRNCFAFNDAGRNSSYLLPATKTPGCCWLLTGISWIRSATRCYANVRRVLRPFLSISPMFFFFVYLQWQNGKLELQYKYKHIHCCCRCRCCKAPRLKWEKRAKSSCFSMLLRHWNR